MDADSWGWGLQIQVMLFAAARAGGMDAALASDLPAPVLTLPPGAAPETLRCQPQSLHHFSSQP